jgi:hypothetical protein
MHRWSKWNAYGWYRRATPCNALVARGTIAKKSRTGKPIPYMSRINAVDRHEGPWQIDGIYPSNPLEDSVRLGQIMPYRMRLAV